MRFRYEGHDRFAKASHGTVEAANEGDAAALLKSKGIFALKISAEGESFRTILPENQRNEPQDIPAEPAPRKPTASILTGQQPAARQASQGFDPLEAELFGGAPGEGQAVVASSSPPPEGLGTKPDPEPLPQLQPLGPLGDKRETWEEGLADEIEAMSAVLRQVNLWKEDYKKAVDEKRPAVGPHIGGKTWEFVAANIEYASRELLREALSRAARAKLDDRYGRALRDPFLKP